MIRLTYIFCQFWQVSLMTLFVFPQNCVRYKILQAWPTLCEFTRTVNRAGDLDRPKLEVRLRVK